MIDDLIIFAYLLIVLTSAIAALRQRIYTRERIRRTAAISCIRTGSYFLVSMPGHA